MTKEDMKLRLRNFALQIVSLVNDMPPTIAGNAIARQIIRSGTSPAANYRAACLGKSDKDFLNKLKMVEEELDETMHWLDMIVGSGMIEKERVLPLYQENQELFRIVVSSILTVRRRLEQSV